VANDAVRKRRSSVVVALEWRSQSHAQCETVERLAARHGGVLVRTLSDGTSEVLAIDGGVFNRYTVGSDGFSMVVEAQPIGWRWPVSRTLLIVGAAMVVLGALLQWLAGSGGWLALFGFVPLVVGALVRRHPWHYADGEGWTELGFPDDGDL
jgi:hypothetical protein